MVLFGSFTQAQISGNAQAKLVNLQTALQAAADYYVWLSANTQAELEAIGFSTADTTALFNAFADASELYTIYNGGTLGTYTLPYNFSTSIRVIMGPAVT